MRWIAIFLLCTAACSSPRSDEPAEQQTQQAQQAQPLPAVAEVPAHDEFRRAAHSSTGKLQIQLKQELSQAMGEGGAGAAVGVCSSRATELTAQVSQETGLEVRRVSLRNRNPANQASVGEAAVLAAMAGQPSLADTLVVRDGQPLYMRAIRISNELCLKCHGMAEDLDPAVMAQIDEFYDADKATGFAKGDLRGAFVVKPLTTE